MGGEVRGGREECKGSVGGASSYDVDVIRWNVVAVCRYTVPLPRGAVGLGYFELRCELMDGFQEHRNKYNIVFMPTSKAIEFEILNIHNSLVPYVQ